MLTRIGNVEVWRILESVEAFMDPLEFFPDLGEDGLELMRKVVQRQLCPDTGLLLLPIETSRRSSAAFALAAFKETLVSPPRAISCLFACNEYRSIHCPPPSARLTSHRPPPSQCLPVFNASSWFLPLGSRFSCPKIDTLFLGI